MVLKLNFKGAMAPVLTPFCKNSGDLNISVIPLYANYLLKAGVKAILVNGTNGEGEGLTMDERKLVSEEWMKVAKGKLTVMVQVGGRSLREVQELAKHAESLGADSLLCLPDLFYRPKSIKQLVDYLKYVSDAAPKTSLFYYHNPAYTGVILNMAEFLREGESQIKTLGGIKFASNNFDEATECLTVNRNEFTVFIGKVPMAQARVLGFDSYTPLGLNLVPDLTFDIMDYVQKNNIKAAFDCQNTFNNIMAIITKNEFFAGTKAAMSFISGIEMGDPRPPLVALNTEQKKQLELELHKLNLLK